jgi:conjugative relaxase-like TrwC/TraI family protein
MLSISSGMSASQAGGYFSREDYYLKGADLNSRWQGKGAESLGLAGPVREEDFRALCAGRHPVTGEQIVAPKPVRNKKTGEMGEVHRAGNDFTFSAPKSVSILYAAGDLRVKEAHDAAVAAVLRHIEERYTFYRSNRGIVRGGMTAALFDHATSRNLDPQLHTHVFMLNAVSTEEGGWRGNWNRTAFQDQKSLGMLYRQQLVLELDSRGYPFVFTDRSQMFFELEGIDAKLIEHFSSRRAAIERQVSAWSKDGKFAGVPHARLYEMAALESRDPKREVTRADVARVFEQGFESCGTSSLEVRRQMEQSRELALGRERPPPEYSASEVVGLAAQRLVEREAVLDRARLLDQAVLISGGRHGISELNLALDGGDHGVLRLGEDGRGREYYTTDEMRTLEARNLETLRGLPGFRSVTSPEEVEAFLETVEEREGVRLSAGQNEQVLNELTGARAVGVVDGKAGTGKTLASRVIERFNTEVLRPQGKEHFTINAAYTGQAAQEMERASGRPGFTVDALLNARARGEVRLQREIGGEIRLVVSGEEILISEDVQVVLRVDEAGMLGARQAGHLLQMVRELQDEGVPVKLQLIGDLRQMQALQAGDLFRQALELGEQGEADVAHLNEILRQREPEVLGIARELNREDRLLRENAREAFHTLREKGRVIEKLQREELVAAAVGEYRTQSRHPSHDHARTAAGEGQSVLLITSTNADRKELNRQIREARLAAGEIGEGKTFRVLTPAVVGVTADGYLKGEEIVFSGYRGEDGKMQRWGARLNTVGTVTGIDVRKNRVEVSYSFMAKNRSGEAVARSVKKSLPAAEMAGKTTVYREEQRNFAVGDRVVTLKNDRDLGVRNGSLGTVRQIDESGNPVVAFGKREISLDLSRYRHFDHAYAVTLHKSQASTVEHAILFAPVQPVAGEGAALGRDYGRVSYNALNVAVTRAQYGTTVLTNSADELAREVERVEVKSSTLNPLPGAKRRRPKLPGPEADPAGPKAPESGLPPGDRATVSPLSGGGLVEAAARTLPAPEGIRDAGRIPGKEGVRLGKSETPDPKGTLARDKFDRGAKFGKRLDELALAGKSKAPDDLLQKFPRALPSVGKTIDAPVKKIRIKGIKMDI